MNEWMRLKLARALFEGSGLGRSASCRMPISKCRSRNADLFASLPGLERPPSLGQRCLADGALAAGWTLSRGLLVASGRSGRAPRAVARGGSRRLPRPIRIRAPADTQPPGRSARPLRALLRGCGVLCFLGSRDLGPRLPLAEAELQWLRPGPPAPGTVGGSLCRGPRGSGSRGEFAARPHKS